MAGTVTCLWTPSQIQAYALDSQVQETMMLGYWQGVPIQVLRLAEGQELSGVQHLPLRQALLGSDALLQGLLARAAQLLRWAQDHRFCSRCGAPLQDSATERLRCCHACHLDFYPRINPCVIVLVHRGPYMLLAQGQRFPRPFLSCLAGFVEAGESVEEAIHREIHEEVGIYVQNLYYVDSQPWPFPHSLMLGFEAEYLSGDLQPDGREIVRAEWVHAQAVVDTAPPGSIAHRLIERHRLRFAHTD